MKTIDNDIKMNKIKRAYLLYGEERYLIRQYRDKIKNALVSSDDTMNFSVYEGADINQKEIIDLAETLPFFADRRLILIEDSGIFKKGGEDLAEYLPTAPETTCFVFVENEVDKRSKIYKALGQIGAAVEFFPGACIYSGYDKGSSGLPAGTGLHTPPEPKAHS